MRRTILFVEQQSWRGGAQRVLEAALDSVSDEYHCVVAFPDQGPFRSALDQKNVETMDLPIGNYQPGQKSFLEGITFAWRSLYSAFKLVRVIRRRQIALLYVNGPRCLPAAVLAAWWTGRPTIFHLHLILNRRLEAGLVAWFSRRVSRILACSQAAAASLLDRAPKLSGKMQVLYNPLARPPDSGGRGKRGDGDQFTLGMVGRVTETKGHHLLLRALGDLPLELREKLRLIVVGAPAPGCEPDSRYAAALRREAARLGLDSQIYWAGYQTDPGGFYETMDVLVHPALAEAMCIVILEALSRGIPVIAARTGGIPEVVQDGVNGLLVSLEDSRALSRALKFFLERSEVRERLRAGACRSLDRRFSMDVFSSNILAAVRERCPSTSAEAAVHTGGFQRW
jgi:glycosyltransferase involved in cell wall biosynthesis